jgi:hypothetical protein
MIMGHAAPQLFSMRAAAVAADPVLVSAYLRFLVPRRRGGVDGPEAGGSQGEENLRMIAHRGGHAVVASRSAGVHELPGVAGVEI